MGTSSIYKGPKDLNKVNSIEQSSGLGISTNWKTMKTIFSKYVNSRSGGKPTTISISGISKLFVRNYGGTSSLVIKSHDAIIATARLVSFLSSASEIGLVNAIENLGINNEGLNTSETLSILASFFSPDASTKEDSVIRHASIEAMSAFYEYLERNNLDFESVDKPTGAIKKKIIEIFISEYIFGLIMKDMFAKFEQYKQNEKNIAAIEKEFKDFIHSKVDVELTSFFDVDEVAQNDFEQKVTDLYCNIFDILGGQE